MIYDLTIPQFSKMLSNMLAVFDKATAAAEAKKYDVDVLVRSRLAPDQFDFTRQIQIMCDTAKRGVSFLTGKEAPVQEDNEKSLTELRARVKSVLSYLETFKPADFNGAAERKVSQPRWEGQHMTGHEYLVQHVIPNFYFHFTTAYAILRHNGVDVGKKDYLGKMPLKK